MPGFDTVADAAAAGIPEEIDGVSLDLEQMNVIGQMTDLVLDRGVRLTRKGAISSAVRTFQKLYWVSAGTWRMRDSVELSGPDRVVVQRGHRALADD